jgi:AraC-like DNA-binding protein
MATAAASIDPWDGVSIIIRHADLYPCRPEWSIPEATAVYDNLMYVVKGHGWMEQDGLRLDADPGDWFITRTGGRCSAGHDPKDPVTVYSTGFHLFRAGQTNALRPFALPFRLRVPNDVRGKIEDAYGELVDERRAATTVSRLAARGSLLKLIALAIHLSETLEASRKTGATASQPGEQTRVAGIMSFIDAHLGKPMTLRSLATKTHLSPVYFSRLFRAQTGLSPMAYVRRRRIEMACSLLAGSDESVERIARKVGFEDPFHFSRVFSATVGQAPSAYRAGLKNPFLR